MFVDLRWKDTDVTDPAEDDGVAVQDAALWLHLQAAADVMFQKLSPVHLRGKIHNKTSEQGKRTEAAQKQKTVT